MRRLLAEPRTWLIGGAVAGLVVLAVGWLMLIAPERSASRDLQRQTAHSEQRSAVLRTTVATLKAKSANSDQYAAVLAQAEAALPPDSGLPTFTRQLNAASSVAGVHLSALVVGGVTPVVAAAGDSSGATGPGGATPPPATAGAPRSAAGGLFSVRVTITTKGSMSDQLAFLRALRTGPRRALVGGTQFMPAGSSKHLSIERSSTLTTDVTVFSAPQTPQQVRQLRQLLAALRG